MRSPAAGLLFAATLLTTPAHTDDAPGGSEARGLDPALQRTRPRRLGAQDPGLRRGRQLRSHLPRRERGPQGLVRSLRLVQGPLRPPLLRTGLLALHPGCGVSIRGRAGAGRPGLGLPEQRAHDSRPARGDHGQGPGLPDLHRGAAPRRTRLREAADREPLHAGHERGHGRPAHHRALHQLELEDLRRRRVGEGRGRGPRKRPRGASGQRRAGAPLREAADRRGSRVGLRSRGEAGREAPVRGLDLPPVREPPRGVSQGGAARPRGLHGPQGPELPALLRRGRLPRPASTSPDYS